MKKKFEKKIKVKIVNKCKSQCYWISKKLN